MSFLIQRSAGRGLSLTQINTTVLRIGRGTNQELRSENPAVALEHAVIEADAAGYVVTDRGSITGTYVNRKPVESSRLSKGDVVEIGDLRIEVQLADPAKPLFLRVVTSRVSPAAAMDDDDDEDLVVAPAAAPGTRVVKARKIDYISAYKLTRPWLTKLTLTALLLIVALAIIGEVIPTEKHRAFMPGAVSAAHARAFAGRCDGCHTPWKSVSNEKCIGCHRQPPHAPKASMVSSALQEPACFSCHTEHRGARKLADVADERCVACHASLPSRAKAAAFDQRHPELVYPPDPNTLRFNHQFHLVPRGVFNGTGRREVLQCTSCHVLGTVKGKSDPVPVDFEAHCQRCHRLTFDARFPNAEVPHGGDPKTVYGYVGDLYSQNRTLANKSPDEVRRILASRKTVALDARAHFAADHVVKDKCRTCHDIESRGAELAVRPPVMRSQWLTRAQFTHSTPHQVDCEKCHGGARRSAATSDVLMPRRASCEECHASGAKVAQGRSTCLTCHEYHLQPGRPIVTASLVPGGGGAVGGRERMLQGILIAVIVVLLLVVLIPVGIALFQRLRPERTPPPAAPRPPAAPLPPTLKTPALSDIPTDKVSRPAPPPPPAPRPPAPAPPSSSDPTRIEPLPVSAASEPESRSGTEMVQWYGLLNCTAGELEGQRFVVEEGGFYIGRDPVLSTVVIHDKRISKRHVRIVPRDGNVWAIDEGSTNGTFLASAMGTRITEVQLKRGDTLVLGDNAATFVYQI